MKSVCGVLTFANIATVTALVLGIVFRGLNPYLACLAVGVGAGVAVLAFIRTTDPDAITKSTIPDSDTKLSKRAQIRMQREGTPPETQPASRKYANAWVWILAVFFAVFAVRSFCWLLYIDGSELRIQSPNNLGDLSLHITHINYFANGVPLWPANPIYVFSDHLRYPAGIDLFNALLSLLHIDLMTGLVWTGLVASAATFWALYRWGKSFAIAGFLFNGGIAGFQFLHDWHQFIDYQGDKTVAWKSIPLSMFVTQRGLLYAIPAGLVLLWHWRRKYFPESASFAPANVSPPATDNSSREGPLPFWLELSLYASMPLFHLHTFIALTIVLVCFCALGDPIVRGHVFILLISAFIPATFFTWLITDHFHAKSVLEWHPGWVENDDDFKMPFFRFWLSNFGLLVPLVITLIAMAGWRLKQSKFFEGGYDWAKKFPEEIVFLAAAAVIFLLTFFIKFAPWGWDNLKIMIWAYFLVLPLLWKYLITEWDLSIRVAVCFLLFGSGFVSLFGGLASPGFSFADRAELDGVGIGVRKLPIEARFAAFPTYNHPLLLQGRKVALGYPGHLWTQGFDDYGKANDLLTQLMLGAPNWRQLADQLKVDYIFWGREENTNYAASKRPWEKTLIPAMSPAPWGTIYDVHSTALIR